MATLHWDSTGQQDPQTRDKEVGRYSRALKIAVAALNPDVDVVDWVRPDWHEDEDDIDGWEIREIDEDDDLIYCTGRADLSPALEDAEAGKVVLTSPAYSWIDDSSVLAAQRILAVVYDLAPLIYEPTLLPTAPLKACYARVRAALRRYDHLATVSESTRRNLLTLIPGLTATPLTIGTAHDPDIFMAQEEFDEDEGPDAIAEFGLSPGQYIFHGAAPTDAEATYKGTYRLVRAYLAMASERGEETVLAIEGDLEDCVQRKIESLVCSHAASRAGRDFRGAVIFTEAVEPSTLAHLYGNALLTAVPSEYEGLALPIYESYACGTPVVFGDNSAQVVAAGTGAYARSCQADRVQDIGRALTEYLVKLPSAKATIRAAALVKASTSSMADVAAALLDELEIDHDSP
jgi:glycosyltransferase involved in cell wall biosynthesis